MDEIQKELIKAGRKDLAQEYYKKVAGVGVPKDTTIRWNMFMTAPGIMKDLGANMADFYSSADIDINKIKKEVDAVLKIIGKGAVDRIKQLSKK